MVGSESLRHKHDKAKVGLILRKYGYQVRGDYDNEIPIPITIAFGNDKKHAFWPDLYAERNNHVIITEIDGYKGHHSARAIKKDKERLNYIKNVVEKEGKTCTICRFAFWQIYKMPEDVIARELGLRQ